MIIKCLNCTFYCVQKVIARFYQLYSYFLLFGVFIDYLGSYIVNDVEDRFEASFIQVHYVVLGCCYH